MDYYYFSLCHVCKKPSPDLKKCSLCKVLHYCSREHQRSDWHSHKQLCKVITRTNKNLVFPSVGTSKDFAHFKYSRSLLWQLRLGRPLCSLEVQMWMYPEICAVCYSNETTITCQTCLTVAYCSQEHQQSHREAHRQSCQSMKLSLVMYQNVGRGDFSRDWSKYKINSGVHRLPDSTERVLQLMGFNLVPDLSRGHVEFLMMADIFCAILNIIFALEKSGFVENRHGKKTKLVVHVVGCGVSEFLVAWGPALQFLSHWIFNLKRVKILLIGPEMSHEIKPDFKLCECVECVEKNFTGSVIGIGDLYREFVWSGGRPDLVVALNCGLHEFSNGGEDTWGQSIPALFRFRGVPVMLTAYTEVEMARDVARLPEAQIKFLVKPQKNPYSNLTPIRNWKETGGAVFYENSYIAIVAKK